MLCPCHSQQTYTNCCEPFHKNTQKARTPEQLMRSRYCAYALKLSQYIFDTYHSDKQADLSLGELEEWAKATTWLKLEVSKTSDTTVTFIATYAENRKLYKIEEHSRFEQEQINQQKVWRYVDGDILNHQELDRPKRNDPCPCGSMKKLKQCCGVKSKLI